MGKRNFDRPRYKTARKQTAKVFPAQTIPPEFRTTPVSGSQAESRSTARSRSCLAGIHEATASESRYANRTSGKASLGRIGGSLQRQYQPSHLERPVTVSSSINRPTKPTVAPSMPVNTPFFADLSSFSSTTYTPVKTEKSKTKMISVDRMPVATSSAKIA